MEYVTQTVYKQSQCFMKKKVVESISHRITGISNFLNSPNFFPKCAISKTRNSPELHRNAQFVFFRKFTIFFYNLRSVATCTYYKKSIQTVCVCLSSDTVCIRCM
jgi:hypothetical protein